MNKPPVITQIATLKLVRKPRPPAGRVILDKATKARRKRVKRVTPPSDFAAYPDGYQGPYQTPSQFNSL